MSKYLTRHGTRSTPQSQPVSPDQTLNEAGGYVWAVDAWTLVRRFLILGTEGGSYYSTEFKATKGAAEGLRSAAQTDGVRLVKEIVEVSEGGRAPKNDPALFALAVAISHGNEETRRAAAEALPRVARIGTHLYHFVAYAETMRGWGKLLRKAVAGWYEAKAEDPYGFALNAIKYRQRDGWSHRDLLRLSHPDFSTPEGRAVAHFLSGNVSPRGEGEQHELIEAFEMAQRATDPLETAGLVRSFNLPREALKTEHLNSPEVWEALLYSGGKHGMPITALIRNLATMTRVGLLTPGSEATRKVREMVTTQDLLTHARVHPMQLLIASRTYASGQGLRGRNVWNPVASVVDALDDGFYLAFGNVEPIGKRIVIGVDSSGSMYGTWVNGVPGLSAGEAACAMALIHINADPDTEVVAFDTKWKTFPLTPKVRLDTVMRTWQSIGLGGGTNVGLPFRFATTQKRQVDAFLTLTDAQTWHGMSHPVEALREYRDRYGPARYVEIAMVANRWSTGDPKDLNTLRVAGFDTTTPQITTGFLRGEF